ncbi:MAG TPA: DivIVA domain-containing protein, partial [Nocardioides sp.]|nr:DivIVA domain-containing protein [Nocardioides sp.]
SLVAADGPVTADDLRRIRFPVAFRGYRMAEVDALLDRLAEEREAADAGPPATESPAPSEPRGREVADVGESPD